MCVCVCVCVCATFERWTSIFLVYVTLSGTAEKGQWQDVGLDIRIQLWAWLRHIVHD